jgi:hypothetical protein
MDTPAHPVLFPKDFLSSWNKRRPRRVLQHEDSMRKSGNLSENKIEEQEESK